MPILLKLTHIKLDVNEITIELSAQVILENVVASNARAMVRPSLLPANVIPRGMTNCPNALLRDAVAEGHPSRAS